MGHYSDLVTLWWPPQGSRETPKVTTGQHCNCPEPGVSEVAQVCLLSCFWRKYQEQLTSNIVTEKLCLKAPLQNCLQERTLWCVSEIAERVHARADYGKYVITPVKYVITPASYYPMLFGACMRRTQF